MTLANKLAAALLMGIAICTNAATLPTGWTLSDGGIGEQMGPETDLPPSQGEGFAFIDSTGTTDLVATLVPGATTGSVLLSSRLYFDVRQSLSLDLNFLTNDGDEYADFAVVQLLEANSGAYVATLYTANTTCDVCRAVPAIGGPGAPSAGVTLNPDAAYFDGRFTGLIGGIPYGPGKWLEGTGGATGWVKSTYDVEPGIYQLAFIVGNVLEPGLESALLIDNLRTNTALIEGFETTPPVPEPAEQMLLTAGLLALLAHRLLRSDKPLASEANQVA